MMARANTHILMAIYTRANKKTARNTVKAPTHGQTDHYSLLNSKTVRDTEKAPSHGQTVENTLVYTKTTKNTDLEHESILTEKKSTSNFETAN